MLKPGPCPPEEYGLRCSELVKGDDDISMTWFEWFVHEEQYDAAIRLLGYAPVIMTLRVKSFDLAISSGEPKLITCLYDKAVASSRHASSVVSTIRILVSSGHKDVVIGTILPATRFKEFTDMYANGDLLDSIVLQAVGVSSKYSALTWLQEYGAEKGGKGVVQLFLAL